MNVVGVLQKIGNAEDKNPEYRIGGCDSDGVAGGTATGRRGYSEY